MSQQDTGRTRRLILVLGDQLNASSAAFEGFDPAVDAVWMAEVAGEAEHVWSHKARIALSLSAMRHLRDALRAEGRRVDYRQIDDPSNRGTLFSELADAVRRLRPRKLVVVQPGEWRVEHALRTVAGRVGVEAEVRPDRHFICPRARFERYADERKMLVAEHFYRWMRRGEGVLMDGDSPRGAQWNYDAHNRRAFGRDGPDQIPRPVSFPPDELTREVLAVVSERFARHPGSLDHFDWPVTATQARRALDDFIQHRLPRFGPYQDAMWTGEPFLYHSRLSAPMNLKLLDPREAIAAAEEASNAEAAPLNSVEGFIRQVLGWREFVRGVYWRHMPGYAKRNALEANRALPGFYWGGDVGMNCLRQCIGQTLQYGYAHHIQRLMVTGLFPLLLGVEPAQVHQWYLAVYVDAVEWVEMPNTLGMSQFADGGIMATKPYCASGSYIQRMSNYCSGCRYNPAELTSRSACPFTTLYWDFLLRNRQRLADSPRMAPQLHNLQRFSRQEQSSLRERAMRMADDVEQL